MASATSESQKLQLFEKVLELDEPPANKQKLSCISTWSGDYPTMKAQVMESVFSVLETDEDVHNRIHAFEVLAKISKSDNSDWNMILEALLQFLQSDMPAERAALNKLLFELFHDKAEEWLMTTFNCFFESEMESVYRCRLLRLLCSEELAEKISREIQSTIDLANDLIREALVDATPGEWERLVDQLCDINRADPVVVADILAFSFTRELTERDGFDAYSPASIERFLRVAAFFPRLVREDGASPDVLLQYAGKYLFPEFYSIDPKYQTPIIKSLSEILMVRVDSKAAEENLQAAYDLLKTVKVLKADPTFNMSHIEGALFILHQLGSACLRNPIEILCGQEEPTQEFLNVMKDLYYFAMERKRQLNQSTPKGNWTMSNDLKNDLMAMINNLKNIHGAADELINNRHPNFTNELLLSWRSNCSRNATSAISIKRRRAYNDSIEHTAENFYPMTEEGNQSSSKPARKQHRNGPKKQHQKQYQKQRQPSPQNDWATEDSPAKSESKADSMEVDKTESPKPKGDKALPSPGKKRSTRPESSTEPAPKKAKVSSPEKPTDEAPEFVFTEVVAPPPDPEYDIPNKKAQHQNKNQNRKQRKPNTGNKGHSHHEPQHHKNKRGNNNPYNRKPQSRT